MRSESLSCFGKVTERTPFGVVRTLHQQPARPGAGASVQTRIL
jgi:hypothetical protein